MSTTPTRFVTVLTSWKRLSVSAMPTFMPVGLGRYQYSQVCGIYYLTLQLANIMK